MAVLLLVSCSENNSQTKHSIEEMETQEQHSKKIVTSRLPYYKGSGHEPGFSLIIEMDMKGFLNTTLINNYGADTLHGNFSRVALYENKKPAMASNEVKLTGMFESANMQEAITISLFGENCTDAAGKVWPSSCKISWGNTALQGCGEYQE